MIAKSLIGEAIYIQNILEEIKKDKTPEDIIHIKLLNTIDE